MTLREALDRAGGYASERTQEIAVRVYEPPSSVYSTHDEITFLRGLLTGSAKSGNGVWTVNGWSGKGANPEAFVKYSRLILAGMRTYGANVDVARVRTEILRLMPSLGKRPESHPAVLEPEDWDRTTDADYGPEAKERRQRERVA